MSCVHLRLRPSRQDCFYFLHACPFQDMMEPNKYFAHFAFHLSVSVEKGKKFNNHASILSFMVHNPPSLLLLLAV